MYIASQREMQILDRYTIETLGLPGAVLMENAGAAVVQEIIAHFPSTETKILILAGGGNNGGDGFVIARKLVDSGYEVMLCLAVSESHLKGDAKVHFDVYKKRNLPLFHYDETNAEQLLTYIKHSNLIVDALLGTGISGEVRAPFVDIIRLVNDSSKEVYAVDIPSGVNSNTGEVSNVAIKASKTITFALPKIGFFIGEGPQYIGDWKVADISVPPEIVQILQLDLPYLLDEQIAKRAVPKRVTYGHKGTFGHCLVIGGCINYVGAPMYTAKAAFHTGVGLVTLAIPESIYPIVAVKCPESLYLPLPSDEGTITSSAFEEIDFSKFKVIAFGPGIGRKVNGDALWETLILKLSEQSIVVDADAIYFMKNHLEKIKSYNGNVIVTPHPGEMATLTGLTIKEVENNRLEIAKQFATKYNVYLLLKGHRSILATPKGELWINPFGNDALGKGGSGDVLTGMITSFLTQGANPLDAMLAASYYHATAAEQVGKEISNYGITPMEVIHQVSKQLLDL